MPKKFEIDKLPVNIRNDLLKSVKDNPSWTIDDHLMWLLDAGFSISRSALHRWLQANTNVAATETQEFIPARIAALNAASKIYAGNDPDELIALAERLIDWLFALM